jgi:hypothetical protein
MMTALMRRPTSSELPRTEFDSLQAAGREESDNAIVTVVTEQISVALNRLGPPEEVRVALEQLVAELIAAAPQNLAGLIIYGGLARGRFRAGQSDVDLVVLLRETSVAALSTIAPALRFAWRALRDEPFILSPDEVPRLALLFPTKLLDIQAHHVVLFGEDPFIAVSASREEIRYRTEQELRNLGLRLRRRFVAVADDEQGQVQAIRAVIRPLAIQLGWLLRVSGHEVQASDQSASIFGEAAKAWKLDGELLSQLVAMRTDGGTTGDSRTLFDRLLKTIARVAEIAQELKVMP